MGRHFGPGSLGTRLSCFRRDRRTRADDRGDVADRQRRRHLLHRTELVRRGRPAWSARGLSVDVGGLIWTSRSQGRDVVRLGRDRHDVKYVLPLVSRRSLWSMSSRGPDNSGDEAEGRPSTQATGSGAAIVAIGATGAVTKSTLNRCPENTGFNGRQTPQSEPCGSARTS